MSGWSRKEGKDRGGVLRNVVQDETRSDFEQLRPLAAPKPLWVRPTLMESLGPLKISPGQMRAAPPFTLVIVALDFLFTIRLTRDYYACGGTHKHSAGPHCCLK